MLYIYIYIYLLTCVWVIVHIVWWTFEAMWVALSSHESSWPSMGICSRWLLQAHIHAILCAQSSRCDCLGPYHQMTLVSLCMWHISACSNTLEGFCSSQCEHVDTHHIHRCETLSVRYSTPNMKLWWIFTVKMGHPHFHILTSKSWWE